MPNTKTTKRAAKASSKRASRAQKTVSARKSAKPAQDRPAHKAFAYGDRVDVMVAEIKSLGGSATKAELFEALYDGDDGMFATERRIPATLRQNARARELMVNVGGTFSLVKRARKVAKKSSAKRGKKASRKS